MTTNSRKSTPDIMAGLMGSTTPKGQENAHAIKQENDTIKNEMNIKTLQQESNKIITEAAVSNSTQRENAKASFRYSNKATDEGKQKTTFNLSASTLDALEDTWVNLRRKLKGDCRVTKTLIVEKALEIAINDLEKRSELSDLFRSIKSDQI